ncbi:MAG: hypothetical protein RLZZ299_1222 [Pseudomonadota bacterium]
MPPPAFVLPRTVDAVVCVVGDRVITRSDVVMEEALAARDPSSVPPWSRRDRTALERLVDAAVLRLAAGDVSVYRPGEGDVLARVDRLRGREGPAATMAFLARWGLDEGGLQALLYRRMVVERFVVRALSTRAAAAGRRLEVGAEGWDAEYDALVADLRARTAIRSVSAEAP